MVGRPIIYQGKSPDGRWNLTIYGFEPSDVSTCFYAEFSSIEGGHTAFPFGFRALPETVKVNWKLPDNVCAIHIGSKCYALFRWGRTRRRNRDYYRTRGDIPYTEAEIEHICAKKHVRLRNRA